MTNTRVPHQQILYCIVLLIQLCELNTLHIHAAVLHPIISDLGTSVTCKAHSLLRVFVWPPMVSKNDVPRPNPPISSQRFSDASRMARPSGLVEEGQCQRQDLRGGFRHQKRRFGRETVRMISPLIVLYHLERIDGATPLPYIMFIMAPENKSPHFGEWRSPSTFTTLRFYKFGGGVTSYYPVFFVASDWKDP